MIVFLLIPLIIQVSLWNSLDYFDNPLSDIPVLSHSGRCFRPTSESLQYTQKQDLTCILAHPGQYPPEKSRYNHVFERCCFKQSPEDSLFWAIGESVMSKVITVPKSDVGNSGNDHTFKLYPAQLQDVLVLDANTDDPVPNVRISLADDAVHLISYAKLTDDDGYAVFPVISGESYVLTFRAEDYLAPVPQKLSAIENPQEFIVEIDPGISLSGTVVTPLLEPLENARLHVEIDRNEGNTWSSDLDLPKNISALALDSTGWSASRSSYTSSESGKFQLQSLPHGKIRIYATHERYAPSDWVTLDASNATDLSSVMLTLQTPKQAWIRVESKEHVAIPADLTVFDANTSAEVHSLKMPSSGAVQLNNLPENARFFVFSDGFAPLMVSKVINDRDEIILTLEQAASDAIDLTVLNLDNHPVAHATLGLSPAEVQKNYPLCLAKTDSQGMAKLEYCPQNFWLDVYHPDYAQSRIFIDLTHPTNAPIFLSSGQRLKLDMLDDKTKAPIEDVSCTLSEIFSHDDETSLATETIRISDGHLVREHIPDVRLKISCTALPNRVVEQEFSLNQAPESLLFPHISSRDCIVVDAFGAPVPYARIDLDNRQLETDDFGKIRIQARPDEPLSVFHWQHGHLKTAFQEGTSELELRLPDVPVPGISECLDAHHLKHIQDSASTILDTELAGKNIRRGDYVESCSDKLLVIVRDGYRIQIPL